MKSLVGLTGVARSGKDTFSQMLQELTEFETYAFASPLKRIVNSIFKWDERHSDGELKEVVSLYRIENWRDILILECREVFGKHIEKVEDSDLCYRFYMACIFDFLQSENEHTEVANVRISPRQAYQRFGTEFGRSINSNIWLVLANEKYESVDKGLIITDVRFDNEAEFIRSKRGHVVKLTRNSVTPVSGHVSELGISPELIDYPIDNNKGLWELEQSAALTVIMLGL